MTTKIAREGLPDDAGLRRCDICLGYFVGYGNNPRPFTEGVCCDVCNSTIVLPFRLSKLGGEV